jgi:hypothetical protein
MDMVSKPPIIHLPVCTHLMVSRSMGPSSAQDEEGFHGVVAVVGFLVAGEGSVVGDNKKIVFAWGPSMEPNPLTPLGGKEDLPNGRHG